MQLKSDLLRLTSCELPNSSVSFSTCQSLSPPLSLTPSPQGPADLHEPVRAGQPLPPRLLPHGRGPPRGGPPQPRAAGGRQGKVSQLEDFFPSQLEDFFFHFSQLSYSLPSLSTSLHLSISFSDLSI